MVDAITDPPQLMCDVCQTDYTDGGGPVFARGSYYADDKRGYVACAQCAKLYHSHTIKAVLVDRFHSTEDEDAHPEETY